MSTTDLTRMLRESIRTIPDLPRKGILFRDITTLFGQPAAFRQAVDALVAPYMDGKIAMVAGIEARGFVLGGAVAHQLFCGFVPLRKKGKLPSEVLQQEYELEYGTDIIEMHVDAIKPGDRVLVVDDLIATGGTAEAAIRLLRQRDAEIVAACFVIDLPDIGGSKRIEKLGVPVRKLIDFEGH